MDCTWAALTGSGSDATVASRASFMMLMVSGGNDAFGKSFVSTQSRLNPKASVATLIVAICFRSPSRTAPSHGRTGAFRPRQSPVFRRSSARPNKAGRGGVQRTMPVMAGGVLPVSLANSVAVVADTDAHARRAETNTSARLLVVTPTLDVAIARSIGV
jgi:hypothetical protein